MNTNEINEIQKITGIIGESPKVKEIVQMIASVSDTNIPVLILGESGSGKEVIAQAVHKLSNRSEKEMVSVNCGAIPEGLIESELFGHEKGSFTGAISSRKGYFELADNGTIFLDEVAELPLQTQVKLLRVLETGIFMRVGGTQYKKVDVRVLAATNRKLEQMVEKGNFRMDLFYRLKGVQLQIPSLRERKGDIKEFINLFVSNFSRQNNIKQPEILPEAYEMLIEYQWPGNVRELKNVVETILVLSRGGKINSQMVSEHLVLSFPGGEYKASPILPAVTNKSVEQAERELIYRAIVSMGVELTEIKKFLASSMQHIDQKIDYLSGNTQHFWEDDSEEIIALDELERKAITNALKKYRGNKKEIAQKLNISERTLYRKIKEFGLEND